MSAGAAVLRLMAAAACGLVPSGAWAQPAPQPQAVAVAAGRLDRALARLADALGVQLLFDPALATQVRTHAVHGRMTAQAAFAAALAGTGLVAVRVDGRVWAVRRALPAPHAVPPPAAPPPRALPPLVPPEPVAWPDILVTAARFAQSPQKVSASLAVVAGADLATRGPLAAPQALAGMPGINVSSQPGGYSINLRALGADMPSGTTQGSVALEFDGLYTLMALGTNIGWFDLDRVEVTKGPQGTRYGPNAEAGVVQVVTRQPHLDADGGQATLSTGSAGLVRLDLAQDVPLGPSAALRVAAMAMRRASWFHPALARVDNQSFRARLLLHDGADTTLTLGAQLDHIGGTGTGGEAGTPVQIDKVAPYAAGSINQGKDPWAQGDRASDGYDPARSRANLWQQTLTAHLAAGLRPGVWLDLVAGHIGIAGSQVSCVHDGAPWATSGAGACYRTHEYAPYAQSSVELRLHSADDAPLRWTAGQYFWQFGKTSWAEGGQAVAGPAGGPQVGMRTLALFGEATVPLRQGLRLVAGARQSWDNRLLRPAAVAQTYRAGFHHADVRLGYELDLPGGGLHYTVLASGYRPGGLTYSGSAGRALEFASQSTLALETGIKARLPAQRLQVNLAAFAYRQRNYQDIDNYSGFAVMLADGSSYVCQAASGQPPACAVPVFTIARASNLGLEAQLAWRPTASDTLAVETTAMRARFGTGLARCAQVAAPTAPGCWIGYNDQQTGALRFARVDGAVLPHAPALSVSARYAHVVALGRAGTLTLGADLFHSAGYWVGPVEDAALLGWQPGYWQAGVSARLVVLDGRLEMAGWVHNLGNYAVKLSVLPATTIGDPRNGGLSLKLIW